MPVLQLDGNASGAVTATTQVTDAAKKLSSAFKEVGDATDKAGQSHQEAFGEHALGHLAQHVAQALAVHKAIEIVNEALTKEIELRKQLAEQDKTALTSIGELSAAGGTKADLAFARKLQSQGLVADESEAVRATTGIVKAQLTDKERNYAFDLAERRDVAPAQIGEFSEGIKAYQERFGGTFEDDSKKIFAAAKIGKMSPAEVAGGFAKLSKVGKDQGVSPDEILATFTTLMRSASTRREAIPESTEIFEGKADLEDFGPGMKATYAKQLQAIQGAVSKPETANLTDVDPRSIAAKTAERAVAGEQSVIRDQSAQWESNYETYNAARRTALRKRGASAVDIWAEDAREWVERRIASAMGMDKSPPAEDRSEDIHNTLKEQTELMKKQDQRPPTGGFGRAE